MIKVKLSACKPKVKKLVKAAQKATKAAYAPYSNYKVGAALLLEDGTIVTGSNQENAVYPVGLCAERVALFASGHQYPKKKIKALVVDTAHEKVAFPCGSCRQAIKEFETRFDQPIKIYVVKNSKTLFVMDSVNEILPYAFDEANLS